MGAVCGERHAPYTLQIPNVDSEKIVGAFEPLQKAELNFFDSQISTIQVAINSHIPIVSLLLSLILYTMYR